MKRRDTIVLLGGAVVWPLTARAQSQAAATATADNQIGQVATVQGSATLTRANAAAALLKASDAILRGDELQTGANSSLGITLDDETTFSLSANTRIVMNEFVYREGAKGNRGLFNAARGTVAFVAGFLAKTGDMKITTETAAIGIRGTTGVIDVPEAAGTAGEAKVKLYPDADGRVGRIEVFNPQGAPRHLNARCERVCGPPRSRGASDGRTVPHSAAGSRARPRRTAAAVCFPHHRAADGDPAQAIAQAATANPAAGPAPNAAQAQSADPAQKAVAKSIRRHSEFEQQCRAWRCSLDSRRSCRDVQARSAASISSMYSSPLAITSMEAYGRNDASVLERSSSDFCSLPMISAMVITLRALQASPMTEAASALVPALDTITTRSADATSSTSALARPATSLSHAFMDQLSPPAVLSYLSDVKKFARCQVCWATRLITRSLTASSETTLITRGCELG
jgi:hypothetical protein